MKFSYICEQNITLMSEFTFILALTLAGVLTFFFIKKQKKSPEPKSHESKIVSFSEKKSEPEKEFEKEPEKEPEPEVKPVKRAPSIKDF